MWEVWRGEGAALGKGLGFAGRLSHLGDLSKRLLCEPQCIRA